MEEEHLLRTQLEAVNKTIRTLQMERLQIIRKLEGKK